MVDWILGEKNKIEVYIQMHFKYGGTDRLKVKRWKNIHNVKYKLQKTDVTTLKAEKVDRKTENTSPKIMSFCSNSIDI